MGKNGIHAKVSENGYLTYWTRGAAQNGNTLEEMVGHMLNLSSSDGAEIRQYSGIFATHSFLDVGLVGNINDGLGGFAEGLSYNGKNGIKLYVGTARPGIPVDLGFTKFYGNGKTYIQPAYMGKVGGVLGKASIAGTVIIGGINIYNGIQKDGGTFGLNATIATGGTIGGVAGAYGGAILGAAIGVWFGGVGAAPGALIGGIIGGVVGGITGTKAAEMIVN
ncbi:hypothetical protein [Chryseobacterium vrystaatense]|uniref:Glycine zipper n=1 Tax=Chryseobacterium vrystaatense TaxID=307480 RepID=A0A1M5JMF1_9FLAO|nr:hypothetical protein [Chryseobacterium vrystaatense]SHG41439.1 hypothetical protein SAMN02787073_4243 [Chryseobacterium vrystaatense]